MFLPLLQCITSTFSSSSCLIHTLIVRNTATIQPQAHFHKHHTPEAGLQQLSHGLRAGADGFVHIKPNKILLEKSDPKGGRF